MTVIARARAVIATVALATLMGAALAQPQPAINPAPPQPARTPSSLPPGPIETMDAFSVVEGWVRAWEVGNTSALPKALETTGGCAITLRLDHRVVGRGISFETGLAAIASATRAAMDDAATRTHVVRDATELDQRRAHAKRMAISLELAGTRTPLDAATFAEIDALLQPGLDGVAVRVGDTHAGMFPSEMLITNLPPSDATIAAVAQASGDPALAVKIDPKGQPAELRKDGRVVFQKFRVTHVAQSDESGAATVLVRGGRIVQPLEVTTPALTSFADTLARHLRARVDWKSPDLTMTGSVMPFQGRTLAQASTVEKLITTAALARHARRHKGMTKPFNLELLDIHRLRASASNDALRGPVESAAWIIASREIDRAPQPYEPTAVLDPSGNFVDKGNNTPDLEKVRIDPVLRAQIGARVVAAYDPETGWTAEVPDGAKGFVAYALAIESTAENLDAAERTARRARADQAIRSIFTDTPPAKLVGQMPWLGMAELLLAENDVPAAPALESVRELVWKHQLTSEDSAGEADDLIGGIVFTSSANPLPTAQSVRPVLLLAIMARDRRLTTDDQAWRELSRLLSASRFLRQLSIDHWSAYAAVDPVAADGGVRSSLWDQRQPVEATALTLWAVCEVLETTEELGKR
ncbi:MAG TPA: hypothetical protein VD997_11770 [Phycisphaerales bacterium]|nr:hypothetical protein [Phycisphaerales bacterium]